MISRVTQDPQTHNLELNYVDDRGAHPDGRIRPGGALRGPGRTRPPRNWPRSATSPPILGLRGDPAFQDGGDRPGRGFTPAGSSRPPRTSRRPWARPPRPRAPPPLLLSEAKGTLLSRPNYPPEREVAREAPRIGVFVCHCGINIAGVVDVARVCEYARTLPGVVYADHYTFTCATDSLEKMREVIEEQGLNRVVVASCSPRTHEPLFQDNLRKAGLNKYLFEMANIRDQDSWVHQGNPELATAKAKELVRMAVARAAVLEPLTRDCPSR